MATKHTIFVASTVDTGLGGIARSVPALAGSVCGDEGTKVTLLAPVSNSTTISKIQDVGSMSIHLCNGLAGVKGQLKELVHDSGDIDFLYHAGVWNSLNHFIANLSRRTGTPMIVSTRSMLDPWALNHRKWKKKLAWWMYAKRDLLSATLIHATAEMEAEFIREALGRKCPPIIVVPNGVELPDESPTQRAEGKKEIKRLLFLSRIHPKKGVLDLIKAFGELDSEGWELVISGNDDEGHKAVCEDYASHQVNANRILFTGSVSDVDKWDIYRSADLFVLPSYSENFGIVVGEALGSGIPVITTTATPWDRMEEKGCGWWIEPGVDSLVSTMRDAVALSDGERQQMGERGSRWIREEFTWESVGQQFVEAIREHGLL